MVLGQAVQVVMAEAVREAARAMEQMEQPILVEAVVVLRITEHLEMAVLVL
jgi:TPP-dependent pyruvate/acetoin dehydrogenase alpha subunit